MLKFSANSFQQKKQKFIRLLGMKLTIFYFIELTDIDIHTDLMFL